MFYSKYCIFITNISKIGEKVIIRTGNFLNLCDDLHIKQLEVTFRIPSNSKYEYGFITMLMLMEKMSNNKPIFLLDKNTLSRNKTIKVGLILTLKKEMINYYLSLCSIHSIPKFYSFGINFNISKKTNIFSYTLSKILSNTLFSFDKDINSYYDYLGDLVYEFDFLFRTYFKNISMNKLLISNNGIHFINEWNFNDILLKNEIIDFLLSEQNSNSESDFEFESELESDFESDFESESESDSNSDSDIDVNSEYKCNSELSIDINVETYNLYENQFLTNFYLNNFKLENMDEAISNFCIAITGGIINLPIIKNIEKSEWFFNCYHVNNIKNV